MFCHLHVHSGYSFLYGTFTVDALINRLQSIDMRALAVTDREGLYGAVRFQRCCRGTGIKAIIGIEAPLSDNDSLIFLAADSQGYRNLCRMITTVHLEYHGVFTLETIDKHAEGLICLTGGREGRIWRFLERGNAREAGEFLATLNDIFGDRLFLEVQNHYLPGDPTMVQSLIELSAATGIPPAATNSVTFLNRKDYRTHTTLADIQRVVHHHTTTPLPSDQWYLKTEQEMKETIGNKEAITNTGIIADMINFELPLGKLHPPRFSRGDFQRLSTLCFTSIPRKYGTLSLRATRGLWRELSLIKEREFASYFLVVHEIVQWARSQGIRCSLRGSAVSSIVSYLLFGGPDPLEHDLLFERFLNEGRFDPPDIDVDFDSERRDEVLRYIFHRFEGNAALVATVSTFRARGALREAARTLGYSYETIEELTQFMPYHLDPSSISQALDVLPELKHSPLRNEHSLLDVAAKLDGLPRQLSVHLGGVVISENLLDLTPLQRSPRGFPVCQYDKDDVELLGLAKFDILGLRMHTTITKTLRYLQDSGKEVDLDTIPLNDATTYHLLKSTDTVGIFQVESPGQRQLLGRLQPDRFADIIAEISLFRPGPMQAEMIDPFIKRKHGKEPVTFFHPRVQPILSETYGVLIYQEQVLRIVAELTGMGFDEADVFRRSMTKDRGKEEMEALRDTFISRCLGNGINLSTAREAFTQVSAFAGYGFCKAHAVAFAHITYQSSYLKAHFPLEFYLGLLNSGQVGSYPQRVILNEARRRFSVYPPHINRSYFEYAREGTAIRVGLCAIKGIGPAIAERIVMERSHEGPFASPEDFRDRTRVSRSAFNALVGAGALNGLLRDESKAA